MDENQIKGTAQNLGGKVQEGIGRATGSGETQLKGVANQVSGSAKDLYGHAKEGVSDVTNSAGDAVRKFVTEQPYTATVIALGLGWLLGRMHRPL